MIRVEAHGHQFEIDPGDPDDHIALMLAESGFYERPLLGDIRSRCRRGTAIDVGAHIGNHTLWLAGVCGMDVVAVEPNPTSVALLRENVTRNQLEVQVVQAAAGRARGRGRIKLDGPNSGCFRLTLDPEGPVEVLPLDDLALDDVTVLKVDVEGYELEALAGARETIMRCVPVVYVEAADAPARLAVTALMGGLGYERFGRFGSTPVYGFWRR